MTQAGGSVRLYVDAEDPCSGRLQIFSKDQAGLLFKLCELLTSHGIDIGSAEISTSAGVVHNSFELRTSRPSDLADASDWCRELEEFLLRTQEHAALEGPLAAVTQRLSVNPDLLSVVSFKELPIHSGPPSEIRYSLELEGINQAGLLTYFALVLCRCGFNVISATISTYEGHISDTFELSTTSPEAEQRLRSFLDVPEPVPMGKQESFMLPFHVTGSDADLQALMTMWGKRSPPTRGRSSSGSLGSSPIASRAGSFVEEDGEAMRMGRQMSNLAADKEEVISAAESQGDSKKPRWMSVEFANGDVYTGYCLQSESGTRRQGLGTYLYSPDTHESYKQYRGQWRDDRKHGYGVLFYRNGGAYVGQWENNHKHGLGVFLDTTGPDQTSMPCYRYEGQWQQDEPHGLGAEETSSVSYFGHFAKGRPQDRGVRMHVASKAANAGCEVLAGHGGRPVPLMEALENEMLRWEKAETAEEAALLSGRWEPSDFVVADAPPVTLGVADRQRRGMPMIQHLDPESSSSGKTSVDTRSPPTGHAHIGTPSEGQGTPAIGAGFGLLSGMPQREPRNMGRGVPRAAPLDAQSSSSSSGAPSSPLTISAGHEARRRSLQEVPSSSFQGPGSVVFSLWEENDLLSPSPNGRGPQEGGPSADQHRRAVKAATTEPWDPSRLLSRPGEGRDSKTSPDGPAAGPAVGLELPSGIAKEEHEGRRARTPKASVRNKRAVRSPLLWTEDELAAFLTCLGMSSHVSARVRSCKLKGVSHMLQMSNTHLRRDFGLVTPVERLVVRQALKRLIEADRWENSVRTHKAGDILTDSVLNRYLVPVSELTLVTKISQGGYGTVYRGVLEPTQDRAGGKLSAGKSHLVAVKEMKGERRVRLWELLKEACVMASLSHSNICTFVGVCSDTEKKKEYIISELMDCSLFDLIHQPQKLRWQGELTVSLAVHIGRGICSGIVYIHERKLVHADLKSSNVLIDHSSTWQLIPRICDFGHAAVRTFPTPHHRCGTPHWAGPEVLRSEALGPAADIYSFGVIMWEMLTQKLPHKGLSFSQVLAAVGWAGWLPDLSLLPELPAEVLRLIKDCLRFSPASRPQARDVQRRLRRVPRQVRLRALQMLSSFCGWES